jgi:SAM-dependent methyltransferase
MGVDSSRGYIEFAQQRITDICVKFQPGDAQSLPVESGDYDAVVSGLALNFIPNPVQALNEMVRAAQPGRTVAVYVWDYAGRMQFLRHFWNAAAALDPPARDLDEGRRFPICRPEALQQLFEAANLRSIQVLPIDIPTDFRDFDDYWSPFLIGEAPAPGYLSSLSEARRAALRERTRESLPFAVDGSIPLVARAWAVKAVS